jgi:putative FmdB family regulatory protein
MPLYEYECEGCGMRFERRQHMEDEPVRVCPECGGTVHRLIQPVGIIFKGSGFYVTDNRAKSSTSPPRAAKESSDAAKSDAPESDSGAGSSDAPAADASTSD